MPVLFANGLFDQPWLVAVFIIAGLISNWLMKRRQEQEAARQSKGEESSAPAKPEEEFDLETAMRRLLGEPPAAPPPVPPVIPGEQRPPPLTEARRPETDVLPSQPVWQEETAEGWGEEGEQVRPPLPAGPPTVLPPHGAAAVASEATARVVQCLTQTPTAAGPRPTPEVPTREPRFPTSTRGMQWRNPQNARQAFVASLVFGPPKGFEP